MSADVLNSRPLPSQFDGQWWIPQEYVDRLEEALREDMRDKSDLRGYMATIRELWENIPEKFESAPWAQSPDAFRKFALIKTGYNEITIDACESRDEAVRLAHRIRYMARMAHGFAITRVKGDTVECITPLSQSTKAMGKETFKESKSAVLDFCRGIVGVTS